MEAERLKEEERRALEDAERAKVAAEAQEQARALAEAEAAAKEAAQEAERARLAEPAQAEQAQPQTVKPPKKRVPVGLDVEREAARRKTLETQQRIEEERKRLEAEARQAEKRPCDGWSRNGRNGRPSRLVPDLRRLYLDRLRTHKKC